MIKTTEEIVESVGSIISDEVYYEVEPDKVWVDRDKLVEWIEVNSSFDYKHKNYRLFGEVNVNDLLEFIGVDEE